MWIRVAQNRDISEFYSVLILLVKIMRKRIKTKLEKYQCLTPPLGLPENFSIWVALHNFGVDKPFSRKNIQVHLPSAADWSDYKLPMKVQITPSPQNITKRIMVKVSLSFYGFTPTSYNMDTPEDHRKTHGFVFPEINKKKLECWCFVEIQSVNTFRRSRQSLEHPIELFLSLPKLYFQFYCSFSLSTQ